jgi:hypothetical protein
MSNFPFCSFNDLTDSQRIGEKIPCHIFQIEQHTPVTQFWKKVEWEVGIDKGHFMNGKAIRAGMAKQYENKRPQDVRYKTSGGAWCSLSHFFVKRFNMTGYSFPQFAFSV